MIIAPIEAPIKSTPTFCLKIARSAPFEPGARGLDLIAHPSSHLRGLPYNEEHITFAHILTYEPTDLQRRRLPSPWHSRFV